MKFQIAFLFHVPLVYGADCATDFNKICDSTSACACVSSSGSDNCDAATEFCASGADSTDLVDLSSLTDLTLREVGNGAKYCVEGGSRVANKYAKLCSSSEKCNQTPTSSALAHTASDKTGLCVTSSNVLANRAAGGTNKVCIGASATEDCSASQTCNTGGTTSASNNVAASLCITTTNVLANLAVGDASKVCIGTNAADVCLTTETCNTAGTTAASNNVAASICVTTSTNVLANRAVGDASKVCIGTGAADVCLTTETCNTAGNDASTNNAVTSVCVTTSSVLANLAVGDASKICLGTGVASVCATGKICTAAGTTVATTCVAAAAACTTSAPTNCACGTTTKTTCTAAQTCADVTAATGVCAATACTTSAPTNCACGTTTKTTCTAAQTCADVTAATGVCAATTAANAFMPSAIIVYVITLLLA